MRGKRAESHIVGDGVVGDVIDRVEEGEDDDGVVDGEGARHASRPVQRGIGRVQPAVVLLTAEASACVQPTPAVSRPFSGKMLLSGNSNDIEKPQVSGNNFTKRQSGRSRPNNTRRLACDQRRRIPVRQITILDNVTCMPYNTNLLMCISRLHECPAFLCVRNSVL